MASGFLENLWTPAIEVSPRGAPPETGGGLD